VLVKKFCFIFRVDIMYPCSLVELPGSEKSSLSADRWQHLRINYDAQAR